MDSTSHQRRSHARHVTMPGPKALAALGAVCKARVGVRARCQLEPTHVARRLPCCAGGQHTGTDTWTFSSSSASRTADDRPMTPAPNTQILLPLPPLPPLAAATTGLALEGVGVPVYAISGVQPSRAAPMRSCPVCVGGCTLLRHTAAGSGRGSAPRVPPGTGNAPFRSKPWLCSGLRTPR